MLRIPRRRFEGLVREALAELPEEFQSRLVNVEVRVLDRPTPEMLAGTGSDPDHDLLLGLYEGVPLPDRGGDFEGNLSPVTDTVFLFQESLEGVCSTEAELAEEVRKTVVHEIGHYFGFDDDDLEARGF